MPVGSGWVDGGFWFTSGPGTRKSRNLAENPACVITVSTHQFDLVAEGSAARVTDEAMLQKIAAVCREGGWPASVEGDAFRPSSALRRPDRRRGTCTTWSRLASMRSAPQSPTARLASISDRAPNGPPEHRFDARPKGRVEHRHILITGARSDRSHLAGVGGLCCRACSVGCSSAAEVVDSAC